MLGATRCDGWLARFSHASGAQDMTLEFVETLGNPRQP
ncbi:hypothetical protein ACS15_5496 [Ralstonia insidiosa]|uniref:Uncharacterized protein n=1 Tax=Ralstonia insidiosa TaxID=190721 RepID=A0AAC9FT46_9RALS|nr:hypothetical protein ACS15_5496 [Ralstonia insidiosa]